MESVLLAAMITAASTLVPANAPVAAAQLDRSCLRLMADLAEDGDPRIRSLGRTAAQFFLGRIDESAPGYDSEAALEAPAPQGADRARLLGACGNAMQAGGRDFRSIGEALAPQTRPTI